MRMRTILLLSLLSLACGLTVMSLLVIHTGLQKQIRGNLAADLSHSTTTFQNIQRQRQQMLDSEVALLADLPYLKALMTTKDLNTIRDGGVEFWHDSGSDLFALATNSEQIAAVYTDTELSDRPDMELQLKHVLDSPPGQRYLFSNHRLYQVSLRPLIFGPEGSGTPLGYVIAGYAIDDRVIREVREAADADIIFLAANEIVAGKLDARHDADLLQQRGMIDPQATAADLRLGREHYLTASLAIPTFSDIPVQLLVLKSYDQASTFAMRLNRLLLAIGVLVLLVGTVLALYISGTITRPLDALVAGARALGSGNFDYQFQRGGTKELNELGEAFDHMRNQLRQSQQDLVESARLAIIGRMASSISHDLRHYLSAIYANAEFLSHAGIPETEREELLAEVSVAVHGMTDVLESLLIFSRTGKSLHPTNESFGFLVERAAALIRMHPDAHSVAIIVEPLPHIEVWMDARMIERAICNLLINAVQAARTVQAANNGAAPPSVRIGMMESPSLIEIRITDSGPGVPEAISETLFEPFVSIGKRRGIGLGLTIAHRIVQEHGGQVRLEESRPGCTVFVLSLPRNVLDSLRPIEQDESVQPVN